MIAAIFGTSILRDFQRDTYPDPLHQADFEVRLPGRPLGGILRHHGLRLFRPDLRRDCFGTFAPWADHTRIAPDPSLVVSAAVLLDRPWSRFSSSARLFFMVAALSRKIFIVYLQGVALFCLYLIGITSSLPPARSNTSGPASSIPSAVAVPTSITRYWTVVEQNITSPSLVGSFSTTACSGRRRIDRADRRLDHCSPCRSKRSPRARSGRAPPRQQGRNDGNDSSPARSWSQPASARPQVSAPRTTCAQFLSLTRLRISKSCARFPSGRSSS